MPAYLLINIFLFRNIIITLDNLQKEILHIEIILIINYKI